MTKRFEKQVAVITGSASGIGNGIARRIAKEGGKVVLIDMDKKRLKQAVDELIASGFAAEGIAARVDNELMVRKAFNMLESKGLCIDIVIHAAGIVGPTSTSIEQYSLSDFDSIYNANLRGSFLVVKFAVAHMKKNNYGRILLFSSIAGKEGNPGMVGYSSMKAGVIALVKTVGKEYAETGITVKGLAPALIRTDMNSHTDPEQLAYMASKIPMKRLGTVEEVTSLACWIVSKEASFNTGFVFDISGGRATY